MSARPILHAAKERKPRYKPCGAPGCTETFEVKRLGQKTCPNAKCALAYIRAERAAEARRVIRKERQVYRAKTKTISKLIAEAQKEFNRWIRERDFGKPCICCDRMADDRDLVTGSRWDAGHYRSTGAAPHLRFNEDNCHRQLVFCNQHRDGNAVEYRIGLIRRIGIERVEALENNNAPVKWDRDELVAIRRKYLAMWKEAKAKREGL